MTYYSTYSPPHLLLHPYIFVEALNLDPPSLPPNHILKTDLATTMRQVTIVSLLLLVNVTICSALNRPRESSSQDSIKGTSPLPNRPIRHCYLEPNVTHIVKKDIPLDLAALRSDVTHVLHEEIILEFFSSEKGTVHHPFHTVHILRIMHSLTRTQK